MAGPKVAGTLSTLTRPTPGRGHMFRSFAEIPPRLAEHFMQNTDRIMAELILLNASTGRDNTPSYIPSMTDADCRETLLAAKELRDAGLL